MTTEKDVDKLFVDILTESHIQRTSKNGFDKYIIYNDKGTLFVIGFNKKINKYGFGRTPLMLAEYRRIHLPENILPDYRVLYTRVGYAYQVYKEAKPLFDLVDRLSGKKR